jgi:hypothetical protein
LDYSAGFEINLREPQEKDLPEIFLKWIGITTYKHGYLRESYSFFQRLSQRESVGTVYGALVLAALGDVEQARRAIQTLPQSVRENRSLILDCARIFPSDLVSSLLRVNNGGPGLR